MEPNQPEFEKLKNSLRQEAIKYTEDISSNNWRQIETLEERIHKMLKEIKLKSFGWNESSKN